MIFEEIFAICMINLLPFIAFFYFVIKKIEERKVRQTTEELKK